MARINGRQVRRAFTKVLSAVNQQGNTTVYLVKRVKTNGDNLAFGLGENVTIIKVALSPSPLIENPSVSSYRDKNIIYKEGDQIVTFIPPKKEDGSDYTEDELLTFNEIWIGPILNVGQETEHPTKRLYVRRAPCAKINDVIVACNWVCNTTPEHS